MKFLRNRLAAAGCGLAAVALCGLGSGAMGHALTMFQSRSVQQIAFPGSLTLEWPDLLPADGAGAAVRRRDGSLATGLIQHGELASGPSGRNPWPLRLVEALGGTADLGAPPRRLANAVGGFGNLRALQPRGGTVRSDLNGKRVRIAGFVAPIGFKGGEISEFLLVPFVGACVHVPPPPANQIVLVSSASDFNLDGGLLHPVWITGTLRVEPVTTHLARAGYRMDGAEIERYD